MSRRDRIITNTLQVITTVTVLVLLVYAVVESQNLAEERADTAMTASAANRRLLTSLADIVQDVADAQVQQREAFRALARRNEVLHGNDPDDAPTFDSAEVAAEPSDGPTGGAAGPRPDVEPRTQKDPPERDGDPAPTKRRQRPPPAPTTPPRTDPSDPPERRLCVPLVDVCVGER